MRPVQSLIAIITFLILFTETSNAQSVDSTFNTGNGVLSIPAVTVGEQTFFIELTLSNAETLDFLVTGAADRELNTSARAATFSVASNRLLLPVVHVGTDAYAVQFDLVNDNPVTFRISGANLVNSACTMPEVPQHSAVASAVEYNEVQTTTSTQNEFGSVRTIVSDFNGDNNDDLFWMAVSLNGDASEAFNTYLMWLSDGNNGFTDATSTFLPNGLTPDNPRQIFGADFNGDAKTDYLVLQHGYDPGGTNGKDCSNVDCPGAANMLILIGDDGHLRNSAAEAFNPFDTNGFTHAGGVADVDCDGDVDILEGQLKNPLATATNHIQLNDGSGVFTEKADALPEVIRDAGMYGAALCDFDRDGDPDLYVSSLGVPAGLESADNLLLNDGFGMFTLQAGRPAPVSPVGDAQQRAADMRCLDYNNDGYNDILKPNEADSNFPAFELLHNNGDLTFSSVTESKLPQAPLAGGTFTPKLVDLNNDGWVDILAQGNVDTMRIYWNTGAGFEEYIFPATTAIDTSGATLSPGDFDGDGDLDIHVSRSHFDSFILNAQVATSIVISPQSPAISVGGTLELSAAGLDAKGVTVAGTSISWSSATEAVATVDENGLVTGITEGQSVITASSGGVMNSVILTVAAAPFVPSADTMITGDLTAASIDIPAGVTVTLVNGAILSSTGALNIAGNLIGDCVATTLSAGGDLTVTGSVQNSCSSIDGVTPPGLSLSASGAITLTNASLQTTGAISVSNQSTSGMSGTGSLSSAFDCTFTGGNFYGGYGLFSSEGKAGSPMGTDGAAGEDTEFACAGNLTMSGTDISTGFGGNGGSGSSEGGAPAEGGDGGRGGDLQLSAAGDIILKLGGELGAGTPNVWTLGGGGSGGSAFATGQNAIGHGGDGGRTGLPFFTAVGSIIIHVDGALSLKFAGGGGSGGLALSRADDGLDASADSPAEKGRPAQAFGGAGGNLAQFDTAMRLIGDLFLSTVENSSFIRFDEGIGKAGAGGVGEARSGNGGMGSKEFPIGGIGGDVVAVGGDAGFMGLIDNRGSEVPLGTPGVGGNASIGDEFGQQSGWGGNGWSGCKVGDFGNGGNGGAGGSSSGRGGSGGLSAIGAAGADGGVVIRYFGVGGDGGDGVTPGNGGVAGDAAGVIGITDIKAPSLQAGADGSDCAKAMNPFISVESDPNGHAPFIAMSTVSVLNVTPGLGGTITISGDGNWVELVGTIAADGTFHATGSGTVAGFPGVSVSLNGDLNVDSEGNLKGIRTATLTVDTTNSVLPPNADEVRNPAVYSLSAFNTE